MIRPPLRRAGWGAVAGVAAVAAACAAVLAGTAGASADVTKGVKPDIVLGPASHTFHKHYATLLVNDPTPQADDSVVPTPDQCRQLLPLRFFCNVYRIKINRDRSPGAENLVVISVSWPRQASTPDLALVAAGLGASDVPDLDLFLYKDADAFIPYANVGGRGATIPERVAFLATQDEYDLVVRAGTGAATEYSIDARWSNELFSKPFELLDDVTSAVSDNAVDLSGASPTDGTTVAAPLPVLTPAPIDVDPQIAGIGLGATEQFDRGIVGLGEATRPIAATTKPPSTIMLILVMMLLPLTAASGAALLMRRRRDAFTS